MALTDSTIPQKYDEIGFTSESDSSNNNSSPPEEKCINLDAPAVKLERSEVEYSGMNSGDQENLTTLLTKNSSHTSEHTTEPKKAPSNNNNSSSPQESYINFDTPVKLENSEIECSETNLHDPYSDDQENVVRPALIIKNSSDTSEHTSESKNVGIVSSQVRPETIEILIKTPVVRIAGRESESSSESDQEEETSSPSRILSLVAVSLEVEEPQMKKQKLNHTSEPPNKVKIVDATKKQEESSSSGRYGIHECMFCQKIFRDKYHLTRHHFVHIGEKAPDCKLCKKPRDRCGCEPQLPVLVKQHKCEICGKTFRDKYHLTRHGFVHTREKPFKCMFCEKQFSRKDKLSQHSLLHL